METTEVNSTEQAQRAQQMTQLVRDMAAQHGVPEDMIRGLLQLATDDLLELLKAGPIPDTHISSSVPVDDIGPLSCLDWSEPKIGDEDMTVEVAVYIVFEMGHPLAHPDADQGERVFPA